MIERFKYRIRKKIAFNEVRLMKHGLFAVLVALLMFSGIVVASMPGINISSQFSGLCNSIKQTVPIIAFAMLLIAGIIYAAGQIMGAETRARANVWATALLTGGMIGLLIAAAAPYIIWFFATTFSDSPISGTVVAC